MNDNASGQVSVLSKIAHHSQPEGQVSESGDDVLGNGLQQASSRPFDQGYGDSISLRNLQICATLGLDAWGRPGKSQPLILSLTLGVDLDQSSQADDLTHSFSYGQMCSEVMKAVNGQSFESLENLAVTIAILAKDWPGTSLRIEARTPKTLLRTTAGLIKYLNLDRTHDQHATPVSMSHSDRVWRVGSHSWTISALNVSCIIGLNPHERLEKQLVIIDLTIHGAGGSPSSVIASSHQSQTSDVLFHRISQRAYALVEPSAFQTLEALAAMLAEAILLEFKTVVPRVTVKVEKPSALAFVDGAGVRITRRRQDLQKAPMTPS